MVHIKESHMHKAVATLGTCRNHRSIQNEAKWPSSPYPQQMWAFKPRNIHPDLKEKWPWEQLHSSECQMLTYFETQKAKQVVYTLDIRLLFGAGNALEGCEGFLWKPLHKLSLCLGDALQCGSVHPAEYRAVVSPGMSSQLLFPLHVLRNHHECVEETILESRNLTPCDSSRSCASILLNCFVKSL